MNVVHITNSIIGGAGIATYRLHLGLLENNINSKIVCLKNNLLEAKEVYVVKQPNYSLLKRALNKFVPIINVVKNKKQLVKCGGLYEIATFPNTDYRIFKHPLIKKADIVHLHWVGDFINYNSFFNNCRKPIVWTLHDMNPFMGVFHYKYDDEFNFENYKELNKKIIRIKKNAYNKSTINTIVAPSQWLLNGSKNSSLLKYFTHKKLYNGIDISIFKVREVQKVREELKLPLNKMLFCFVSQDVSCYRKGFDVIQEIIDEISNESIQFIAVGKIPRVKHPKINYIGTVNEQEKMAKIYAASDAFILPSREDNLPNTMLESLTCGTPVISSAVGGMIEVIENNKNGYLVKNNTADNFKEAIFEFIKNKNNFNRDDISISATSKFSLNVVSQNYTNLYKSILNGEL